MSRRLRRSLYARLVASLVLACTVTLAADALVQLAPLEHRLRASEVAYLRTSALHAADTFAATESDVDMHREGHPETAAQRAFQSDALAHQIARLTRARVVVVDASGRAVADTDPALPVPMALIRTARVEQRLISTTAGHSQRSVAGVAVPLHGTRLVMALVEPLRRVTTPTAATVRSGLLVAVAIALGTAVVLGLVIGRGLSKRLRRLRDGALRVAEKGIDEDLPADRVPDEIGDLATAFALMQERLRRQEGARRAFVGTASHELRTPLTTLNGSLELLENDLDGDEPDLAAAREDLRRARRQAQRLSNLATDLLELSRIDAGVGPTLSATDLVGTCRSVLAEFAVRADRCGVTLALEPRGAQSIVDADSNAVAQIVRVLVDNGLRFAPRGSTLQVTVASDGPTPLVVVRDEGIGVPEDEREVIFERFRRGSTTGGESGFGLGLAIARELAERMGGSLELRPSAAGATFELRLLSRLAPAV